MITFKEYIEEGKRGLWDNIHAKQERIKNGSGEHMRKPGSKGAPTAAALKASQTNEEDIGKHNNATTGFKPLVDKLTPKYGKEVADKIAGSIKKKVMAKEEAEAQFDLIEKVVADLAVEHNVDPEVLWEELEVVSDEELLEYAVDAIGYKSSTGGLTQKGRDAYNSKGAHLKAPVTTPPSKLKAGSKAANRRKSFCARMSGVEGPMKKPNGEPSRKALALRKWNC